MAIKLDALLTQLTDFLNILRQRRASTHNHRLYVVLGVVENLVQPSISRLCLTLFTIISSGVEILQVFKKSLAVFQALT
jgi:type II secretory pathway component PulF